MFNFLFMSKDCKAFYWITLDYFAYMGKWGAKKNYWGQVMAVLGGGSLWSKPESATSSVPGP